MGECKPIFLVFCITNPAGFAYLETGLYGYAILEPRTVGTRLFSVYGALGGMQEAP